MHRDGAHLVVESPLCPIRVILDDPRSAAVMGALASAGTISQIVARTPGVDVAEVAGLVTLFSEAGLIDQGTIERDESAPEQEPESAPRATFVANPALETWEFHDLLFHSRSRCGRSDRQFGATYRMPHRSPPPAFKTEVATEWFDLERPDAERLERDDPPFALVQQRRRSIREYGQRPLTAQQLGEFLFRVARSTRRWQSEVQAPVGPIEMEFSARPYPAAGGLHELEFYLVVNSCQDLSNGLYHYDPQQHRLGRLSGPTRDTEFLLREAAGSAGIPWETLQVHIILAARFERLAWKYESIAYALLLKDVGVVYQTMYLAATAMDLAPCGLGCGDSDLFARAAGLDYYVESSVGEFLLGSKQ
jgi:SagB-type dehydrogenase family enzyme